jgi:acetaldehyde dehydrogenase/alcohol dehydrogenase
MKTCRIVINMPSSQGGIGDIYNFKLTPSLTLGCGSWGGNSISHNVGVMDLINVKTVAERRENMLWFRAPEKIYTKRGCLPTALAELGEMGKSRAFVVTGPHLYKSGAAAPIFEQLEKMGIQYTCFFDVPNDPTLECARRGAAQMLSFRPDVILALGGGSPMLMTRGVLYTAVTRARELLILVGDDALAYQMIDNFRQSRRYTALRVRLRSLCGAE